MILTLCLGAGISLWALALFCQTFGTAITLRHLRREPPHLDAPFALFPVTILKPLKGADSGMRENLESFFALDYPDYELVFSVADARDPACALARELMRAHPEVPTRLVVGAVEAGPNPKVNNLIVSYEAAKHDWVLIADSNVRVPRDFLKRLVAHLENNTGMVTSIVAPRDPQGWGGRFESTYLSTFYARGMKLAFWAGHPTVVGKAMLFQRSVARRFGGIRALAPYLAEDYVAGEAMRHLGLDVVLATEPVPQHIGEYGFDSFWSRHLRWGRIRKAQAPLAFLAEPWLTCIPSGMIGSWALAHAFGWSAQAVALAHLLAWSACDLLLMARLIRQFRPWFPIAWLLRELMHVPLWIQTASGQTVKWRGRDFRLLPGGVLDTSPKSMDS